MACVLYPIYFTSSIFHIRYSSIILGVYADGIQLQRDHIDLLDIMLGLTTPYNNVVARRYYVY